jgi:hypothetical protein
MEPSASNNVLAQARQPEHRRRRLMTGQLPDFENVQYNLFVECSALLLSAQNKDAGPSAVAAV